MELSDLTMWVIGVLIVLILIYMATTIYDAMSEKEQVVDSNTCQGTKSQSVNSNKVLRAQENYKLAQESAQQIADVGAVITLRNIGDLDEDAKKTLDNEVLKLANKAAQLRECLKDLENKYPEE